MKKTKEKKSKEKNALPDEIVNKIIKLDYVEWKKLIPLQPDNFKELTKENYNKLKQSFIKNNFIMTFAVWENKGKIYLIDGFHRYKLLALLEKEKYKIPERLPAIFINCKDKKEASEFILYYSSSYAEITDLGMNDFINSFDIDINKIAQSINIPTIDLSYMTSDILPSDTFDLNSGETKEPKYIECPKCGHIFKLK